MTETKKPNRWLGPEARLIALFLLFSVGLYVVSDYLRAQVEQNGSVVQTAGRIRLDLNQAFRYIAELDSRDPAVQAAAPDQLAARLQTIETQLAAIRDGGTIPLGPGQTLTIPSAALPASAVPALAAVTDAWAPLKASVQAFLLAPGDSTKREAVIAIARANEVALNRSAGQLIGLISVDSVNKARTQTFVQIGAAILAIAFFFFLIYLYSRQLKRAEAAKNETDEILKTVQSGLFLLDRDGRLGSQHSAQLEKVLPFPRLAGENFLELMRPLVSQQTLGTVKDYLELLFSERVHESLVGSLNPLDRVEVNLSNDSGRLEKRFLEFNFRRVLGEKGLVHLLVSVNDISDRVRLSTELEAARAAADSESEKAVERVVTLLKLDPKLLDDCVPRWGSLLEEANRALRNAGSDTARFGNLVAEVFRPIHTLKGEASGLGLGFLAQRAAAVERELADLRTRDALGGNDFLPATVRLEELYQQYEAVRDVVAQLATLRSSPVTSPADSKSRSATPSAINGVHGDATDAVVATASSPAWANAGTAPSAFAAAIAQSQPAATRATGHDAGGEGAAKPARASADAETPFAVLSPLVERLGAELGKPVDLVVDGLDTRVPERLRAPLRDIVVQLVRNALAHGIESTSARLAAGKSEHGRINATFSARADGHFELVVEDDGSGIDFDRIRQRALELGKLTAQNAATADSRQLLALIFQPGFSTATQVGMVAGQGVGMDIVRKKVAELGGRISVATKSGKHTLFRIAIPAAAVV